MCNNANFTWCIKVFLGGLMCLESELARGRYRLWNWSTPVGGPEAWRWRELGTRSWSPRMCAMCVLSRFWGGIDTIWSLLRKALSSDSSIEASMRACCSAFLFGFFTPDKSDFDRGRIDSKKFFTLDDVDGEVPLALSSLDFFLLLSFEKSPFIPVDPDRGRKSPSTWSRDEWYGPRPGWGLGSVSMRGIAIALRSCNNTEGTTCEWGGGRGRREGTSWSAMCHVTAWYSIQYHTTRQKAIWILLVNHPRSKDSV